MQLDGEIKPGLSTSALLLTAPAPLAGPGGKPCVLDVVTGAGNSQQGPEPAIRVFLKNNLFFVLIETK